MGECLGRSPRVHTRVNAPGIYVRRVIEDRGLTQAAVARGVGITTKHMNQILQGRALPSAVLTVQLARFLEVDPRGLWRMVADHQLDRALSGDHPRVGGSDDDRPDRDLARGTTRERSDPLYD